MEIKSDQEKTIKIRVANRVVGVVRGITFIKKVRGSVHFLKTPPGIAFDLQSLKDAEQAGAEVVEVIDKETGYEYRVMLQDIFNLGFPIERGFGKQIVLSIHFWNKTKPDQQLELF